jgi:hypothetical protein
MPKEGTKFECQSILLLLQVCVLFGDDIESFTMTGPTMLGVLHEAQNLQKLPLRGIDKAKGMLSVCMCVCVCSRAFLVRF